MHTRKDQLPRRKILCDNSLTRTLYKTLQSSGLKPQNYGTVFFTISAEDKEKALPLPHWDVEGTAPTFLFCAS